MTAQNQRERTAAEMRAAFHDRFGKQPRVFRAPGRINVIGEHTDYNDGLVMPAAIDRNAWVAVHPRDDRSLHVRSANFDEVEEIDLDRARHVRRGKWSDYVHGVAVGLEHRGTRLPGADLLVRSNVPIGAGLSSSAALEVASALALASTADAHIEPTEIALLCQTAENDFVGARCGVMDQFIACHGRPGQAMLLDCRNLDFRYVSLPDNVRLLLVNTMVRHDLTAGKYNRRRAECEQALERFHRRDHEVRTLRDVTTDKLEALRETLSRTQFRRVRHVISENARVLAAEEALNAGDGERLGKLLSASHASLRDDYEVSCHELDVLAEIADQTDGVHGSRMMGGGFGGCVLIVIDTDRAEEAALSVAAEYAERTGIEPWTHVCTIVGSAGEIPQSKA